MADSKTDVETLMNEMLPFGQEMLEKYGEFIPYGGAMKPNGEIVSVSGYEGTEHPLSQDIIDLLKDGYRSAVRKGKYKATAIYYDMRITPPKTDIKTDAIAIALDHKDNYSAIVFFPYRLVDEKVVFGEVFAQAGENDIFDTD